MKRTALIGYNGFVGSNLMKKMIFNDYYNSKNIEEIVGKEYDLVISTGITGTKYLANKYPQRDFKQIKQYLNILKTVKLKKLVFISTIDVYDKLENVTENSVIKSENLHAYGKNRLFAEKFVQKNFENFNIIRLPALFGENLKKNFLYDLIYKIPPLIFQEKFLEILKKLDKKEKEIMLFSYNQNEDKNYEYNNQNRKEILKILEKISFFSINFTDSRSSFQFYNLQNLEKDIKIAIKNEIKILNITSEPIFAKELAKKYFGIEMINIKDNIKINYNIKSKYYNIFKGENGYLYTKKQVFKEINKFLDNIKIKENL